MREKLKQLKRLAKTPLRKSEKEEMKREFVQFLNEHPLSHEAPQQAPVFAAPSFFALRFVAAYTVIGLVVAGGFTAGASEFSLPNEPLYVVKTGVNERLLFASAYFSPALSARADQTVLVRRLEEAEQMLLRGQFDAEVADMLDAEIDEHSNELSTYIAEVEQSGATSTASRVKHHYEQTLEAHDPVLDIIRLRRSVPDRERFHGIIDEVVDDHDVTSLRSASNETLRAIKTDVMDEYAETLLADLEALHVEIETHLQTRDDEAVVTEEVSNLLAESNERRDQAEEALLNDEPEEALEHLNDALTAAKEVFEALAHETDTATSTEETVDA